MHAVFAHSPELPKDETHANRAYSHACFVVSRAGMFIGSFQEISLFYSCEKKVLCLLLCEIYAKHRPVKFGSYS